MDNAGEVGPVNCAGLPDSCNVVVAVTDVVVVELSLARDGGDCCGVLVGSICSVELDPD